MIKIALFSDCIADGLCSTYRFVDDEIKGVKGLNFKTKDKISIIEELKKKYEVETFITHGFPTFIKEPKTDDIKVKTLSYKIKNNDLSIYDVIIIFCNVNDYRFFFNYMGESGDMSFDTIMGSYNLIIKELKKYNKEVIFVLPPYTIDNSIMSFSKYLSILKNKIKDANYKYISFYDFLIKKVKNPSIYFPDGVHPSIDNQIIMTNYIVDEIEKIVKIKK